MRIFEKRNGSVLDRIEVTELSKHEQNSTILIVRIIPTCGITHFTLTDESARVADIVKEITAHYREVISS